MRALSSTFEQQSFRRVFGLRETLYLGKVRLRRGARGLGTMRARILYEGPNLDHYYTGLAPQKRWLEDRMGQGGPVWREVGHGTGGSPSPGEAPEVGCTAGRVPVPKKHAR